MDERFDQVRPLADRALIRKIEEKERKFGSIIIPPAANEIDTSWTAEVIAVGKGRTLKNGDLVKPSVKKGDTIIIAKYMGSKVKIDGEEFFVVQDDDILAVVEE